MFFFQDDIGLLIQLHTIPFVQFIFTPQSEHFAPVLHLISSIEYRIFHLNFIPYVIVAIFIHLLNCIILGKITSELLHDRFFRFLSISFFLVNLTYTEPILWFAAQGILLSTFFLSLSFFYWYKFVTDVKLRYFWISVIFSLLSGFSFGIGVAVGLVFAAVSFIYRGKITKRLLPNVIAVYIFTAFFSYIVGPFAAQEKLGRVTPMIVNPLKDGILYIAFIVAGVSRGVVGRFFLPGFEPRHFQILPTIISFLPVIITLFLLWWLLNNRTGLKYKLLLVVLTIFITYPYVWAGFLRFQFGLKQALAERYAYPSIFFFSIFLTMIFHKLMEKNLIKSKKLLALFAIIILLFQSLVFTRNAMLFEVRPVKTREYFLQLHEVLSKSRIIVDLPLPSYINQEYKISQLADVITEAYKSKFIAFDGKFCTVEFRQELKDKNTLLFYREQTKDPVVKKVFSEESLINCLSSRNKNV